MTQEQLVEIEAWAKGPQGHYTQQDVADYAGAAMRVLPALIAQIRKLEAERLTAEERELLGRACMYMFDKSEGELSREFRKAMNEMYPPTGGHAILHTHTAHVAVNIETFRGRIRTHRLRGGEFVFRLNRIYPVHRDESGRGFIRLGEGYGADGVGQSRCRRRDD